MPARTLTARLAIAAGALPLSSLAWACSCPPPAEVDAAFARATVVIQAKATAVQTATEASRQQTVHWQVQQHWKGPHGTGETFVTSTPTACCRCGRSVAAGQQALLYLVGEPPYGLSLCHRYRTADTAAEDRRRLAALVEAQP